MAPIQHSNKASPTSSNDDSLKSAPKPLLSKGTHLHQDTVKAPCSRTLPSTHLHGEYRVTSRPGWKLRSSLIIIQNSGSSRTLPCTAAFCSHQNSKRFSSPSASQHHKQVEYQKEISPQFSPRTFLKLPRNGLLFSEDLNHSLLL